MSRIVKIIVVFLIFVSCKKENKQSLNTPSVDFQIKNYKTFLYDYESSKLYTPKNLNNLTFDLIIKNNSHNTMNIEGANFTYFIFENKNIPISILKVNNKYIDFDEKYDISLKENDSLSILFNFPYLSPSSFNESKQFLDRLFENKDIIKIIYPLEIDNITIEKEIILQKKLPIIFFKNDTLTVINDNVKDITN